MTLATLADEVEALLKQIRASADACGANLELRLQLSLHWLAARKIADALRAVVVSPHLSGRSRLHLVK